MFKELHPRIVREPILSTEPSIGLNRSFRPFPESKWIKCSRCGHTMNISRHPKGWQDGVTHPSTQLNGAVSAGAGTITVDSTTGFLTPLSGTITAFSGLRIGTRVTDASHGLTGGLVTISGTTSYNGTFPIYNVMTDTFDIGAKFVSNDAAGTWIQPEYIFIHDAGTYATDEDVSSAYTAAAGGPRADRVSYTGLTATTFTGCVGALAHDDNRDVFGDVQASSGCPFCSTFQYD